MEMSIELGMRNLGIMRTTSINPMSCNPLSLGLKSSGSKIESLKYIDSPQQSIIINTKKMKKSEIFNKIINHQIKEGILEGLEGL